METSERKEELIKKLLKEEAVRNLLRKKKN
jgi:hypothetical protein